MGEFGIFRLYAFAIARIYICARLHGASETVV